VTLPAFWIPEVNEDLLEARAWYDNIRPELGERFALGKRGNWATGQLLLGRPGNNYGGAGTAQFGQIAGGGDANPQGRALPANDRTVRIRLLECALEAATSGTATMA